jgi:hypothetical protein
MNNPLFTTKRKWNKLRIAVDHVTMTTMIVDMVTTFLVCVIMTTIRKYPPWNSIFPLKMDFRMFHCFEALVDCFMSASNTLFHHFRFNSVSNASSKQEDGMISQSSGML